MFHPFTFTEYIINNVAGRINYYIIICNLINFTDTCTEEQVQHTYTLSQLISSLWNIISEHIIQVWNYCGTSIDYRNLIYIYEKYKRDNYLNIINKLEQLVT